MALTITKVTDGLYQATATPPHARERWRTSAPLQMQELIKELLARGCHQRDIGDALYEQDPDWLDRD